MTFSLSRAVTIARREYLTTVRRKAFVFSVLLTPALMFLSIMLSKSGSDDARAHARQSRIVALVDSSGALANAPLDFQFTPPATPALTPGAKPSAPPRAVPVTARAFASQEEALDSLRAGSVNPVIVVGRDFLADGAIRRYELDTRAITWSADDRALASTSSTAARPSMPPTRGSRPSRIASAKSCTWAANAASRIGDSTSALRSNQGISSTWVQSPSRPSRARP